MIRNKIDIITLGCSKNLVDSERLITQLEAAGYEVEHDSEMPDASLSITNSQSSLRLTFIESVMPSSHLILCHRLQPTRLFCVRDSPERILE